MSQIKINNSQWKVTLFCTSSVFHCIQKIHDNEIKQDLISTKSIFLFKKKGVKEENDKNAGCFVARVLQIFAEAAVRWKGNLANLT